MKLLIVMIFLPNDVVIPTIESKNTTRDSVIVIKFDLFHFYCGNFESGYIHKLKVWNLRKGATTTRKMLSE